MSDGLADTEVVTHSSKTETSTGLMQSLLAGVAETILTIVTVVIIAAMWLPAYLTNSGQKSTVVPMDDGHIGIQHH